MPRGSHSPDLSRRHRAALPLDHRFLAAIGGLLAQVLLLAGCGTGDLPPRPAGLPEGRTGSGTEPGAAGSKGAAPTPVQTVELICGPLEHNASEIVKAAAKVQAGLDKSLIQVNVAGEAGNPGPVALAQAAIGRRPAALILYFLDPAEPEMARAVAEARTKGIPVVVMAGPKAGLPAGEATRSAAEPAKPATEKTAGTSQGTLLYVVPDSFDEPARQFVGAAVRNARNAKLKPENGAILAINKVADPLVPERAQAIRDALKSEGVTAIKDLEVEPYIKTAKDSILAAVKADAKPVLLLATDYAGLTASFQVAADLIANRPMIVAGFSLDENDVNFTRTGEYAGLAIFGPERFLRKAVSVATAAARGDKLPDRITVMVLPLTSAPNTAAGGFEMLKRPHEAGGSGGQRPPQ